MNINIKGHYIFKQGDNIILEGDNLITFHGESFLLNRCINDDFSPMKYIVLGNGNSIPLKTDTQLGNELIRKNASRQADLDDVSVVLSKSFTTAEIVGISEIGVANDKILISHDVFNEIDMSMLNNLIGTVEVEYSFKFSTATIRNGWTKLKNTLHTYYIYEPSNVLRLYEQNTGHGYTKVTNKSLVDNKECSYYYDTITKNLYVHTSKGESPENFDVIIESKFKN